VGAGGRWWGVGGGERWLVVVGGGLRRRPSGRETSGRRRGDVTPAGGPPTNQARLKGVPRQRWCRRCSASRRSNGCISYGCLLRAEWSEALDTE